MKTFIQLSGIFILLICFANCSSSRHATNKVISVSGKVVDSANYPLAGVSIFLSGEKRPVGFTNKDGNFNIPKIPVGKDIEIKFTGFLTTTIRVSKHTEPVIVLKRSDTIIMIKGNPALRQILTCCISRKQLFNGIVMR